MKCVGNPADLGRSAGRAKEQTGTTTERPMTLQELDEDDPEDDDPDDEDLDLDEDDETDLDDDIGDDDDLELTGGSVRGTLGFAER